MTPNINFKKGEDQKKTLARSLRTTGNKSIVTIHIQFYANDWLEISQTSPIGAILDQFIVICGYTLRVHICSLAEQQPKSIGARNPKVGGSIPHGVLRIFSLSRARDKMKKTIYFYFFTGLKNLPSLLFLFTNITLSTLLILAVRKTRVI